MDATERAPLMGPGPLSDGQFYSPPESVAGLWTRTDPKISKISQPFLIDSQAQFHERKSGY